MRGPAGTWLLLFMMASGWASLACTGRADLILDINFGSPVVILTDNEAEDAFGNPIDGISLNRSLGFTGSYFGSAVTRVDVSSNGNLNFSGNTGFVSVGGPTLVARISPLWDDYWLYPGSGAQVLEHKVANSLYAVTWHNVPLYFAPSAPGLTFQVVWFNESTQIGNFQFQPDDIAFSYDIDLESLQDLYAVSGLNNGTGTFVAFPDDDIDANDSNNSKPGFLYSDEARLKLPMAAGEFFLFRPDGNNSYNASRENLFGHSSIPEPSSLSLLAFSAAGYWGYRRLRKRKPRSEETRVEL